MSPFIFGRATGAGAETSLEVHLHDCPYAEDASTDKVPAFSPALHCLLAADWQKEKQEGSSASRPPNLVGCSWPCCPGSGRGAGAWDGRFHLRCKCHRQF